MQTRAIVAAAAGAAAAVTAHALDATGQLPLVRETADVRLAMGPVATAGWLLLAATLAAVAMSTRVLVVGVPAALLVSAAPELYGRHDLGAVADPGAMCGALLQIALLLLVVALALVLHDRLSPRVAGAVVARAARPPLPAVVATPRAASLVVRRSRGPPVAIAH